MLNGDHLLAYRIGASWSLGSTESVSSVPRYAHNIIIAACVSWSRCPSAVLGRPRGRQQLCSDPGHRFDGFLVSRACDARQVCALTASLAGTWPHAAPSAKVSFVAGPPTRSEAVSARTHAANAVSLGCAKRLRVDGGSLPDRQASPDRAVRHSRIEDPSTAHRPRARGVARAHSAGPRAHQGGLYLPTTMSRSRPVRPRRPAAAALRQSGGLGLFDACGV